MEVGAGFVVTARSDRWAQLTHTGCGQAILLANPTSARIDWHVQTHCCSQPGAAWDGGAQAAGYVPHETACLVRYLSWLVTSATVATFAEDECFAAGCEAFEGIRAMLVAADRQRHT
jgi:hypothetical protein